MALFDTTGAEFGFDATGTEVDEWLSGEVGGSPGGEAPGGRGNFGLSLERDREAGGEDTSAGSARALAVVNFVQCPELLCVRSHYICVWSFSCLALPVPKYRY